MPKKFAVMALGLILTVTGGLKALAQDGGGQQGPTAEEIKGFEEQYGGGQNIPAPAASFERPTYEEPGDVPAEIRKLVGEKDLVSIYCAMIKWKSGDFFSAMASLKKNMVPGIEKAKSAGVNIQSPDFDALISEGNAKISGICTAANVDEAKKNIDAFISWSKTQDTGFDSIRDTILNEMQKRGDDLRTKVQAAVNAIIDVEKPKLVAEVTAYANQLGKEKEAQLKGSTAPINEAAIKAELDIKVLAMVAVKKAALETMIRNKVDEIVGNQKAQFEEIGNSFNGIEKAVNNDIQAGKAQYELYKLQAFKLRKDIVLKALDANLQSALAELEKSAADIDEARKQDTTIKSVAEIKAGLIQDRATLEVQVKKAIEAGDDKALQDALFAFRDKWEKIRTEIETAMLNSVSKICDAALSEFNKGKPQIQSGLSQVNDLISQCASDSSEKCVKINSFSGRFNAIKQKSDDLLDEISLGEKVCADPKVDPKSLRNLFTKIQADAEDLKVYGAALEAEKNVTLADSLKGACNQVLPSLDASQSQIENNDLKSLEDNIARCQKNNTEGCADVLGGVKSVNAFKVDVTNFTAKIDKVQTLCQSEASIDTLDALSTTLLTMKQAGEDLKSQAADLQKIQAEKANEKAFCKAVLEGNAQGRTALTNDVAGMNKARTESCADKNNPQCQAYTNLSPLFDDLQKKTDALLIKMASVDKHCETPASTPPNEEILKQADSIQTDHDEISKLVKQIQGEADKYIVQGGQLIEAESAVRSGKGSGPNNFNVEINPSWRPAYYGNGSWYLGNGGDYLEYDITIAAEGSYPIWVRDLSSAIASQWGTRVINISFDGKKVAASEENTVGRNTPYPKGKYAWHKVGEVTLKAGKHVIRVTKVATTSGAADLDAFYLGSKTPAEK